MYFNQAFWDLFLCFFFFKAKSSIEKISNSVLISSQSLFFKKVNQDSGFQEAEKFYHSIGQAKKKKDREGYIFWCYSTSVPQRYQLSFNVTVYT